MIRRLDADSLPAKEVSGFAEVCQTVHDSERCVEAGMDFSTHLCRSQAKAICVIAHLVLVDRFRPRKDGIKDDVPLAEKKLHQKLLANRSEPPSRSRKSSTMSFEGINQFAVENTTSLL